MGRRYSDEEGSYSSTSRKKKKRRSRSRSRSSSSGSRNRSSKSKKSSSRYRSRSRSRSVDRSRRRKYRNSRSRSRDRRNSRSRSRSYSRRSYSRSRSKSPRYRRDRRSRTPRRRSRSRTPRRRSRSRTPRRSSRSRTPRRRRSRSLGDSRGSSQLKGEMSHGKDTANQIQLALKAAAAADEKLKEAGLLSKNIGSNADLGLSFKEQHDRITAIEAIEDDGFEAARFTSSRKQKVQNESSANTASASHENAIFSALPLDIKPDLQSTTKVQGSIMHPNLYIPAEEKMARWRQKLIDMRNKKLEGEAI